MGDNRLLFLELFKYFEQVDLHLVVGQLTEKDQAPRKQKLAVNFADRRKVASFSYFEMPSLVVHLSSAVISFSVPFCYYEIFPSFLQLGFVDFLDLYSLRSESMFGTHVARIDRSRRTHNPVGHPREILDKVDAATQLLIGGSRCVWEGVRGIDRKRGVIIVRY